MARPTTTRYAPFITPALAWRSSTDCELAQGYFIAKPMPPAEIPGWISAWEANVGNLMGSPGTLR